MHAVAAQQSGDLDVYYVQQHFGLTIPLAAAFAVFGAIYFMIGRRAGVRFPWHLAWGQFVLSLAGVLLIEAPAVALSGIAGNEDFPTAFRFWSNVSAAGYLAVWASLLLFIYLAFAGLRARKPTRG